MYYEDCCHFEENNIMNLIKVLKILTCNEFSRNDLIINKFILVQVFQEENYFQWMTLDLINPCLLIKA